MPSDRHDYAAGKPNADKCREVARLVSDRNQHRLIPCQTVAAQYACYHARPGRKLAIAKCAVLFLERGLRGELATSVRQQSSEVVSYWRPFRSGHHATRSPLAIHLCGRPA